jgi:hypothetical protein
MPRFSFCFPKRLVIFFYQQRDRVVGDLPQANRHALGTCSQECAPQAHNAFCPTDLSRTRITRRQDNRLRL